METSEDYFWKQVNMNADEKAFWQNIGLNKQIVRFWNKVDIKTPDECWNWKAGVDAYNYGSVKTMVDGILWHRANRLAFYLHFKVNPGELNVCHTCDNALCVNPYHFFLGTQADNMRDYKVKNGLMPNPTVKHPTDKKMLLNDAKNILYLLKHKLGLAKDIARVYRVTLQTILAIRNGTSWKKLER